MQIQTVIVLDRDDRHILRNLDHAANLAGVAEIDTKEFRAMREADVPEAQRETFLALKSLRLIQNDKFTTDDVDRAVALIRGLIEAKIARSNIADMGMLSGLFASKDAERGYIEGIRDSANHALRELDTFLAEFAALGEEEETTA